MKRATRQLFKPVDIAPLVFFRIAGGGLITIELIGELVTDYRKPFLFQHFHFSYLFFQWLEPWPPLGVHAHMIFNIAMGVLVTVGLFYRASAVLLFLGTASLFLMEKAAYINHTYLYILVSFILIFIPAHHAISFDARRRPEIRSGSAPAWALYLLLFQISVVYIFAGIAKLNPDWLSGTPMKIWLPRRAGYPVIGPLLTKESLAVALSYAGAALDLLVVPGMLWRRSRNYVFAAVVIFHLTNVALFGIGTFPWFSIVMTSLFFPPESFRRLRPFRKRLPDYKPVDFLGSLARGKRRLMISGLTLYAALQILIPSRGWLYPGNTLWTEEGHMFSWRMMLRSKTGSMEFFVRDNESERVWVESPRHRLDFRQYRAMVGKPDMILEFAHHLADRYRERGYTDIEIRASVLIGLNGRGRQQMVDPRADLAAEERNLGHYDWILPLEDHSDR